MKISLKRVSIMLMATLLATAGCRISQKEEPAGNNWLEEMTISQLQQGYKDGRYTIREVVSAYLDRIEKIDRSGPELNSVIIVNPDALTIAEELDMELSKGKMRGPMHGIPVILKDNIDTHDKMPTSAGATVLRNSFPKADSYIAMKLREAGAVIIGKSNLSEWANFRGMHSTSGWSGVGGLTKNPYVLDRNPCGSSSGSGVAVSANLCMIAIGTETNGSIVCPSNNNGIVGLKPTVGLLSRSGIIPISFTQDTPGPMGRTVEDVAICLGTLTGVDPSDSKSVASEGKYLTDYTKFLNKEGLNGKRIGVFKGSASFHYRVDSLFSRAVEDVKKMGGIIVELDPPDESVYENSSWQVLLYEFKDGINKYLEGLGSDAPVKSLKELIEFNKADPVELRYFDQKILELAEQKGDLGSAEYRESIDKMLKATREEGIDKLMNLNNLNAIMAPTGSPAWKTDLILGDHYMGGSSSLAAISGYPAISVPMGFIDNLPVGVTFFGKAWTEPILLEIAYSYEQATKHRKAPKYLLSD